MSGIFRRPAGSTSGDRPSAGGPAGAPHGRAGVSLDPLDRSELSSERIGIIDY
jgi:hypothetical protein